MIVLHFISHCGQVYNCIYIVGWFRKLKKGTLTRRECLCCENAIFWVWKEVAGHFVVLYCLFICFAERNSSWNRFFSHFRQGIIFKSLFAFRRSAGSYDVVIFNIGL